MPVSAIANAPQLPAVPGSLLQQHVSSPLVSASLLVIFDARVNDLEVLYQGLVPGAIAYTLNAQDDALSVITKLLAETGATRLAIVAHGEPGVVHLGAAPLTLEQVQARSALLQEWGVESIALYSCEVAKGEEGRSFVQQLSELTGASVAATATKTGCVALGGNWDLDITTGKIDHSQIFISALIATYTFVMANASIISFPTSVFLNAVDFGWYDQYGGHNSNNNNTFTADEDGIEYRSFFVFNQSYTFQPGVLTGASLTNFYSFNVFTDQPQETLNIRQVTTDPNSLIAGTAGVSGFTDLGDGSTYGALSFNSSFSNQYFDIALNSGGLSFLGNTAQDISSNLIAFGGSLSTLSLGGSYEGIFARSGGHAPSLVLTLGNLTGTGIVTEDISSQLTASGNLAISDIDPGQAAFSTSVTPLSSNLGNLSITQDGQWTYSVNNSAVQYLGSSAQRVETFSVRSFDGTATRNISVTIRGVNDAPTVGSFNINFREDNTFAFNTFAPNLFTQYFNDIDGNSLSKIKILSLPANGVLKLGNSAVAVDQEIAAANLGNLSFTPSANFNGTVSFSWNASDGMAYAATPAVVNLIISPENDAPVVANAIADQAAIGDTAFSFVLPASTFSDIDAGDVLTYSAKLENGNPLPTWITFNAATRTFNGTPDNNNIGTLNLKVTATDTAGASVSDVFSLGVRALAAGDLDPTFGTGGKVTTDFNNGFDEARDVVVQPNGKVVVAGYAYNTSGGSYDFGLSRYNSDGSLDLSFGNGGKITTDFNGYDDVGLSMTQQSDGKLLVTGYAYNTSSGSYDFGLSRYNSDGSLDLSFGNGGKITTDFNGYDEARDVVVQPDGKIIVAGYAYNTSGGNYDFGLSRYNSDGTPDLSFGAGGKVTTDFNGYDDNGYSITQQSDGKLVVTGFANNPSGGGNFALSRYNSDGSLDTNFGAGGKVTTDFNGSTDIGVSVTQQSDGKLVVAGFADNLSGSSYDFALSRYNSNGTPDTSFGAGGKVTTDFNGSTDYGFSVTQQSDGKLVVTGYATNPSGGGNFALSRYNSDGTLDTSFGAGGKVTTDFNGSIGYSVAIQPDGNIILVGNSDGNFAVARYLGGNQFPTNLSLSSNSLAENSSNGTVVGSLTTSDPNVGDTHTYTLLNNAGGRFAIEGNQVVVFDSSLLNYEAAASHTIRVRTTDNSGLSYEEDLAIELSNINEAPTVTTLLADQLATEDTAFSFVLPTDAFSDVDAGDVLTYTATLADDNPLPAWLTFNATTRSFNGTPDNTNVGSVNVKVTATDGSGLSADDVFALAIANTNDAPERVGAIDPPFLSEDSPFSFTIPETTFSDPDGDTLIYTATTADGSALPAWLSFDAATRTFSGTPPQDAGSPSITVTASDGQAAASATFMLSVSNVNDSPVLVSPIADQAIAQGSEIVVSFSGVFSDPDSGLSVRATLENGAPLPSWLSLDGGSLRGTPGNSDVGTLSIKVTAADNQYEVSDVFTLTVNNINDAPVVTNAIAPQSVSEDSPFSFTIPTNAFADPDGDALTYTASLADGNALPAWITFDAATRTFSGTPDDADLATLNIKVTAADPFGTSTFQVFQVAVAPTDDPTIIGAPAQQTIDEDTSLVFSSATGNAITLADVDAGNSLLQVYLMVTSYSGSDSPGSLTLGDTSGLSYVSEDRRSFRGTLAAINATLEGLNFYPNSDYNGTANLQVMVSNPDTGSASSNSISILVNPVNDAPNLHLGIAPIVSEDEPFSFSFSQAYDPDDRYYGTIPITYSAKLADGSDLPDWISFVPNTRTFSGTPTNANIGTLNIEVTASDGEASSSEVFTLTIANVNDAPALTGTPATLIGSEDTPYTIASTTLLQGFTDLDGDSLSIADLTATNGNLVNNDDDTYTFTPAANFNGVVTLNYSVIDGNGGVTVGSQSWAIAPINDPVTGSPTAILSAAIEDTAYTVTATTLLQGFSDIDSTTNGQSLSITNLTASNGTLTLNPDGISWTLAPAANFNGNATLTYDVTDGNGSALTGQTRSFNLAAVNDAPLAAGTATLATIAEGTLSPGGATVNSLFAATFNDAADQVTEGSSANFLTGIAIVGNAAPSTQGVWQYSSNGTSWTTISTSVTNTSARSLSPTALLRFLPTTNFSGTPGTLSIRLIERVPVTNGALINVSPNGGSTVYSANLVGLNTTITPINDAPVLTPSRARSLTTIKEDPATNAGTLVSTFLSTVVTDADVGAAKGIAVTGLTGSANGTWQYGNGSNWVDFGDVSATDALLLSSSTLVRFIPTLNYNGSVNLSYRAWDQTSGIVGEKADSRISGGSSSFSTAIATSNLTIAPVNDAPLLTGTKSTLIAGTEDAGYTIRASELLTGFSDVEGDTLSAINLKATNGTLSAYKSTTGTWTFTPTANYNGTVNLSYNVIDGKGGSLGATQSFAIAAINDAPVLTAASVKSLTTIKEDPTTNPGTLASTFFSTSIKDADISAIRGVAVTGITDGDNGIWQYSNGSNWMDFGSLSSTNALLLSSSTLVRFTPTLNYNGSVGLSYRAWDQTFGIVGGSADTSTNGGSTAFSTAIATSSLSITPINDAPINAVPTAQSTNEDTILVFSSATGNAINISDVDAGNNLLRVTLSTSNGTLQLGNTSSLGTITGNGTTTLTVNGTLSNLNTALDGLQFAPKANFNGNTTLTINTNDLGYSGSGGALSDIDAIAITVNPINDTPVNTLPTTPQSVLQGSSLVFSNSNRIAISDVDANNAIEQITLSVSNGSVGISNASGLIGLSGNNTGTVSLQGSVSGLNTALNGLWFTPDAQAVIAGVVNLAIATSDLGSNGAGGVQMDMDTFAIAVNAANLIQGTINNNTLTGSSLNNFIQGFDGDDIIFGNGGQDIIFGGTGTDTIRTGSGNDFIDAGFGNDTIYLGGGRDTLVLAQGNGVDTIYGYAAGSTQFKLDAGFSFSDLSIIQSGNNTLISSSSVILASLDRTQVNTLNAGNFI